MPARGRQAPFLLILRDVSSASRRISTDPILSNLQHTPMILHGFRKTLSLPYFGTAFGFDASSVVNWLTISRQIFAISSSTGCLSTSNFTIGTYAFIVITGP